jgi:Ca-activated chloride channel family protein
LPASKHPAAELSIRMDPDIGGGTAMNRQHCGQRLNWLYRALRFASRLTAVWVALTCVAARGQGLLVNVSPDEHVRLPRPIVVHLPHSRPVTVPHDTYKIKSLEVNAKLEGSVAQVQVSQSFVNTGSRTMQVAFVFPLPYDGAIDRLTLMVDGKELPAKLLPKDEARRRYEEIVRKNQDPALLEWLGSGMFQTSVFPVPPGAERKVILGYTQLCRREQGVTDFLFPLATAKYTAEAIEKVSIRVTIESDAKIKSVYSPTHTVEVKRDSKRATATYTATKEIPTGDFRLLFDSGSGKLAAKVLSYRPSTKDDGYFLLLADPRIEDDDEHPAKTVVFVVDRSGSMSGEKIEQAKGAAKFLIQNLRKGDLFNIIAYDDRVESFKPELQRYDDKTRAEALGFVESIYAGGSTNIDGALTAALKQLHDSSRPSYVLFLTDGLPTTGETNEGKIVTNAQSHNDVRARIVAFGVGYDVNARLLDRLVRANFGRSEYVRPNENIEDRVARLYRRMESPVLTDATFKFVRDEAKSEDGPATNRAYPRDAFDLFAGEQLVIVGRYRKSGHAEVRVEGRVGGEKQEFKFPAELVRDSDDDSFAFIEKLWAVRRVGEIIDELDLKGKNDELVKELVQLSTRHGILTPYTSFLADETVNIHAVTMNAARAERELEQLSAAPSGVAGVAQRAAKGAFQGAISAPAASLGGNSYRDAATDKDVTVAGNRNLGDKSFFYRENRWVDSTVTEEQMRNARRLKQFSDEYFQLAAKHGRRLSQYLVADEPVLLNLDGEALLIEP